MSQSLSLLNGTNSNAALDHQVNSLGVEITVRSDMIGDVHTFFLVRRLVAMNRRGVGRLGDFGKGGL